MFMFGTVIRHNHAVYCELPIYMASYAWNTIYTHICNLEILWFSYVCACSRICKHSNTTLLLTYWSVTWSVAVSISLLPGRQCKPVIWVYTAIYTKIRIYMIKYPLYIYIYIYFRSSKAEAIVLDEILNQQISLVNDSVADWSCFRWRQSVRMPWICSRYGSIGLWSWVAYQIASANISHLIEWFEGKVGSFWGFWVEENQRTGQHVHGI